MITLLAAITSLLSLRIRSRTSLELEVIALRHQRPYPSADVQGDQWSPRFPRREDQKQPELAVGHGAPRPQQPVFAYPPSRLRARRRRGRAGELRNARRNFHCLDHRKRWNGILMTSSAHISTKYLLTMDQLVESSGWHIQAITSRRDVDGRYLAVRLWQLGRDQ
jgi:hypothetical protein